MFRRKKKQDKRLNNFNNTNNFFVPTHEISISKQPVAIIITKGKQVVFRKMPRKQDYFFDKDLGVFAINPQHVFFVEGKGVPLYFYDTRNANSLDLGVLNQLYQWANAQGLYKIRREDVYHAAELRAKGKEALGKEKEAERLKTREFMNKVLEKIDKQNKDTEIKREKEAGTMADNDEYHIISDEESSYIIVRNLNKKLKLNQIESASDLLREIDSFSKVFVSQPIPNELERILDDFHTYKPADIIQIIQLGSKINKGLKNLRTKPVMNWFPATYLLFGALGVAIVLIMFFQYGGQAGDIPLGQNLGF